VVGLEVRDKNDPSGESRVYLPAYKLPHRPYPLGVYLYAIRLYSSNPSMGQREVAGETRKLFGLETFSHTTLGRAMATMAEGIEEKEEVTRRSAAPENPAPVLVKHNTADNKGEPPAATIPPAHAAGKKREQKPFPCVADTREIRCRIAAFLKERLKSPEETAFMEACSELALAWYREKKCLLL